MCYSQFYAFTSIVTVTGAFCFQAVHACSAVCIVIVLWRRHRWFFNMAPWWHCCISLCIMPTTKHSIKVLPALHATCSVCPRARPVHHCWLSQDHTQVASHRLTSTLCTSIWHIDRPITEHTGSSIHNYVWFINNMQSIFWHGYYTLKQLAVIHNFMPSPPLSQNLCFSIFFSKLTAYKNVAVQNLA